MKATIENPIRLLAAALLLALPLTMPAAADGTSWFVRSDGDADADADADAPTLFYVGGEDAAYLGVQLEEETEHEEGGARVTQVIEGSPAAEAGLREGDVVIRFDGDTIRGPVSLTKRIREHEAGDTVRVTVRRDGKRQELEVELGSRAARFRNGYAFSTAPMVLDQLQNIEIPQIDTEQIQKQLAEVRERMKDGTFMTYDVEVAPNVLSFGDCEEGEEDCGFNFRFLTGNRPQLGVYLTEVTPELRVHLGGHEDAGVLVSKVVVGSAADHAGVLVGDLIVDVDGEAIEDTFDLREALGKRAGETFPVTVVRDGREQTVTVTLEEVEEGRNFGPRASTVAPEPPTPPVAPSRAALSRVRALPAPAPGAAGIAPPPLPRVEGAPRPVLPPAPARAVSFADDGVI